MKMSLYAADAVDKLIEIKTNNENYIFTGAIGRDKIVNAINNFKKKS